MPTQRAVPCNCCRFSCNGHQLVFSKLVAICNSVTGSCERTFWRRHEDTNVRGGRHRSSSSTLIQCQSTCVTDADCTGIDWNQASSYKCWHHGWWSTGNRRYDAPGIDHYQLTRNTLCSGNSNTRVHTFSLHQSKARI